MVIIRNGKKYYTLEESINISNEYVEKKANELILWLRKARKEKIDSKKEIYV